MTAADTPRTWPPAWAKRLVACLVGGVVLAMMVGTQEGSQTDYGYGFRQSVLHPRILIFLGIGVLVFFAITFWPRLVPYLSRPGFWPLLSGALAVVAGQWLMNWDDAVGDGKFSTVAKAVADTHGISSITSAYFAWLYWVQLVLLVALGIAAMVLRLRWLAFLTAALSVVAAAICFYAHRSVVDFAHTGPDHSLGYAAATIGFVVMAAAMLTAALSGAESVRARDGLERITAWRPGLMLAGLALVVGIVGFALGKWFSPGNRNLDASGTHDILVGSSAQSITLTYLSWLGWVALLVSVAVSAVAAFLRHRMLGWLAALVGFAATILTLYVLYDISDTGAKAHHFDGATGPWQNLGTGGWMVCGATFLAAGGGLQAALARGSAAKAAQALPDPATGRVPSPQFTRLLVLVAGAVALFYPPTATGFWQTVIVQQIGVAMLLAVGLNVVVGWAGLLDLGFIAFFALGSYTTAYLVGSMPVRPPSWLQMTPLLAIPFAIAVCLIAGLALGAPTLRLRGDYLAIVTLGFGEIIHLAAVNSKGFTNGSEGITTDIQSHSKEVPNPSVHIGPLHIRWGLDPLQYWYLLLILLVIVVVAFRRLEHSRLGRAWAAVREDEVAAQASGVNTTRVKLLAFAIGAATSGIAGVYYASQIGSFTPDSFVLNQSILIVAYVVFGGMGSLPGALAGAAVLTWLPEFLQDQVPQADKLMWIGALMIVMMIFRPAGLVPARRRRAELSHFDDTPSAETTAVPTGEGLGARI